MGWRIVDWDSRYEVNDKNRIWQAGDKFRISRLDYIRLKNHGRKQGVKYRKMLKLAGKKRAGYVWGSFTMFLEIAGDYATPGVPGISRRGILLNEKDELATVEDLAFITGFDERQIEIALQVLCSKEIRWVEEYDAPGIPGNSGNPRSNPTQPNPIKPKLIKPKLIKPKGGSSKSGIQEGRAGPEKTKIATEVQKWALALTTDILLTKHPTESELRGQVNKITRIGLHICTECPDKARQADQLQKVRELLFRKYKQKARDHFAVFINEVNKRWPGWKK